jgi:hypothetical protein
MRFASHGRCAGPHVISALPQGCLFAQMPLMRQNLAAAGSTGLAEGWTFHTAVLGNGRPLTRMTWMMTVHCWTT